MIKEDSYLKRRKLLLKKMQYVVGTLTYPKVYKMGGVKVLNIKFRNELLTVKLDESRYYKTAKFNRNIRHSFIEETYSIQKVDSIYKSYKTELNHQKMHCNRVFLESELKRVIKHISLINQEANDGVCRFVHDGDSIKYYLVGGYHNSRPQYTPIQLWKESIDSYIKGLVGNYALLKGDIDGGNVSLREKQDERAYEVLRALKLRQLIAA